MSKLTPKVVPIRDTEELRAKCHINDRWLKFWRHSGINRRGEEILGFDIMMDREIVINGVETKVSKKLVEFVVSRSDLERILKIVNPGEYVKRKPSPIRRIHAKN